jgi:hypothetical protein
VVTRSRSPATPTTTKIRSAIENANPAASSLPNPSAPIAVRRPRSTRSGTSAGTTGRSADSPNAAAMKSLGERHDVAFGLG